MAIVGFNFNKIVVERKKPATGKVNITNNVKVTDVKEQNLVLGKTKQAGIRFSFEFVCNYEPGIGQIKFEGDVLDLEEEAKAKSILDEWKKNKKIDKNLMAIIINNVLQRSNVKALVLSQDINLPPPIQLPKVEVKADAKPAVKKK